MNKLKLKTPIEWVEDGNFFWGYLDKAIIVRLTFSNGEWNLYAWNMDGVDDENFVELEEAKARAEQLFTDWLNSIAEPSDMIPVEEVRKMVEEMKTVTVIYANANESIIEERFNEITSKYLPMQAKEGV